MTPFLPLWHPSVGGVIATLMQAENRRVVMLQAGLDGEVKYTQQIY
jgi:hypothetical protein